MRVIAPLMVLLLAGAALVHGLRARVDRLSARADISGSVVIHKTLPGQDMLRRVRGGHAASPLADCPVGFCQDV